MFVTNWGNVHRCLFSSSCSEHFFTIRIGELLKSRLCRQLSLSLEMWLFSFADCSVFAKNNRIPEDLDELHQHCWINPCSRFFMIHIIYSGFSDEETRVCRNEINCTKSEVMVWSTPKLCIALTVVVKTYVV